MTAARAPSGLPATPAREHVWLLLSELFVDTQHGDDDLHRLGRALRDVGVSPAAADDILRAEVAPVCGSWMRHATVGPWPSFDRAQLGHAIRQRLARPWYRRLPAGLALWGLPGVRRDWSVVRRAMEAEA